MNSQDGLQVFEMHGRAVSVDDEFQRLAANDDHEQLHKDVVCIAVSTYSFVASERLCSVKEFRRSVKFWCVV